ncbi:MAG: hypothetical protein Kow0037_24760 [Calditrichia bacterium]
MFAIIYRFQIKSEKEKAFMVAWEEVTRALMEHCGGLGSRLHQSSEREFIAYAQWPSREVRDAALLPEAIRNGPSRRMRECCDRLETLYEMDVVTDLLVK